MAQMKGRGAGGTILIEQDMLRNMVEREGFRSYKPGKAIGMLPKGSHSLFGDFPEDYMQDGLSWKKHRPRDYTFSKSASAPTIAPKGPGGVARGLPEKEDPFAGILERSKVAQALRDARASVAKPRRFAGLEGVPLPPIQRARFEKDTPVASSDTSLSMRCTFRSSKNGELGAPIQEDVEVRLEEPELQLEDVGVFQDCNDFLPEASLRAGAPIVGCAEAQGLSDAGHASHEAPPEEEYEAGAADDLALQMHVPPPRSDEESEDDKSEARAAKVTSATDIGSPATSSKAASKRSEGKPRAPGKSRASGNRPLKRKSSKSSLENQESKAEATLQVLPVELEELLVEFEAVAPISIATTAKLAKAFEADPSLMRQVVHILSAHADASPLVLRLAFALGNLTARNDRLREMLMFEFDGAALLTKLLELYWQRDRRLAQAENSLVERGADAQDCESVLVKLVRLLANVAISPSIGKMVASSAPIIDALLDIIGCKRMAQSEELVLNAIAAVTNLLFYETESNLLFSMENKELLCRLLRTLLLESDDVEALLEAARALGNLSRHQDARQWMTELRIDEILSILLAHYDRNLVFYACGALVNFAADPNYNERLSGPDCGLRLKLAAVLRDAPPDDSELKLVAVKVLLNLRLTGNEEACPWTPDEVIGVHESLKLVIGKGAQDDETGVHLDKLASRLDELLPKATEQADSASSDLRPPLPYNRVPFAAAAV
mmetsp:Transcript_104690/g.197304  ORF Transcript_104690/g.197304 Transcript_104690/m.197304 type:complete len:724 (+) Transcript_104690:79-2250(+)